MGRSKLIAVTKMEVGKVSFALNLKSTGLWRGRSESLICPGGAKLCIPAYGTVQTTDGGSL